MAAKLGAAKCITTEKNNDMNLSILNRNICNNNVQDICSVVSDSYILYA